MDFHGFQVWLSPEALQLWGEGLVTHRVASADSDVQGTGGKWASFKGFGAKQDGTEGMWQGAVGAGAQYLRLWVTGTCHPNCLCLKPRHQ